MSSEDGRLPSLQSERDHMVERLQAELLKYKNRATCGEKAARNASNRHERLKAAVEGLLDRYAATLAEETIGAGHELQQAEATPGSH